MTKAKIYPDKDNKGYRLPFFYLHNKLEEKYNYDICTGNGETLQRALSEGIHLVECDGQECLMFSCFKINRMEGYIVLIDDIDGIKDAFDHFEKPFSIFYSHEAEKIKTENINTFNVIKYLRNCITD